MESTESFAKLLLSVLALIVSVVFFLGDALLGR